MVELVSPGVLVKEKDLTLSVRSGATSIGAVGIFAKDGPAHQVITVQDENQLSSIFGKPNGSNFEYWFTAANFLAYSNTLKVVRFITTGMLNATGAGAGVLIPNTISYQDGDGTYGPYSSGQASGLGEFCARWAGAWGKSMDVAWCSTAAGYSEGTAAAGVTTIATANAIGATAITVASGATCNVGDIVYFQQSDGQHYRITGISTNILTIVRYPEAAGVGLSQAVDGTGTAVQVQRYWRWYDQFDRAPGTSAYAAAEGGSNDEMHIIVLDRGGVITGTADTVIEKWDAVSKGSDAKTPEGNANYFPDVLYNSSSYIYWLDFPAGQTNWGTPVLGTNFAAVTTDPGSNVLVNGADGSAPTEGQRSTGYDLFKDPETSDINLLMSGPASVDGAGAITHAVKISDLVAARKDAVGFISPGRDDVVAVATSYDQQRNVVGFFDALASNSYTVFDSGYKKMYDKYNDVYRWVPLNGDIAGVCAYTDAVEDPWWSPGGLTRGQIRGSVELAFDPTQAERDALYRARVNPVVSFAGEGTVLWGDKTGLSANTAFSRINVRRLFITMEEACKVAARSILFEFNDEFTQENFKSMVNPYLADIQGRRGITDFLVVCDSTNNTPQVVDNNEFRADIFVKPTRSINYITLTFVATRTGVDFSEVVGRV